MNKARLGKIASGTRNGTIRIWDLVTRQPVKILFGQHGGFVTALELLSSDQLVSASSDSTIKLWDLGTKSRAIATFTGHVASVTSLAKITATRFASGSRDKTVRVWDTSETTECVASYSCSSEVNSLQLLDDTADLLIGLADGTVSQLDLTWSLKEGEVSKVSSFIS